MRSLLTSAFLLNISCAASVVTAQQTPKSDPKCNEEVVSDKSHPVWKAIDAQYESTNTNAIEMLKKLREQ